MEKFKVSPSGALCEICANLWRIQGVINHGSRIIENELKSHKKEFTVKWRPVFEDLVARTTKGKTKKAEKRRKKKVNQMLKDRWQNERTLILENNITAARVKRLKALYARINSAHPKCATCGLLFGGYHLAVPTKTPLGTICQYCHQDYTRYGEARFIKEKNENYDNGRTPGKSTAPDENN